MNPKSLQEFIETAREYLFAQALSSEDNGCRC